ncbi:expressed unknown protein [Seminavis robusta]|uniref:G-protein coupled receptors family 2 profile 2 domain-containing protein n=1 Tax=Seminavis robusta TaxID=568900 RepID=A0A9N8F0N2_9STRA|nr:expressed unknown protein [Seminavis robusta]|eukprot:Sro2853_g338650.1 n/a (454) ;mRNA; f:2033-3394
MIAAVPLDLYNFGLWDCWINAAPLNCTQSYLLEEGVESDCERGDNAYIYQWVFHLMWVMGSALVVTVNMFLVYRAVLKVEQATDKYMTPGQQKKRERSKAVAVQSYFYVAAMYISWGPVLVARFTQLIGLKATYGMFVSLAITIPMQGVWNAVAYLRPRYLLWRKNQRRIKREKLKLNNNTALTASSRSGPVSSDAMRDNTLKDQSSDDNNNNNTLNTTSRSRHNRTNNMVANSITKSTIRAVALGVIVDEEQQQQSPADEPPSAVKDKTSDDSDSGNYSDDEFFNETHHSNLPALMGNSSHKSNSSNHSLQSLSRLSPRRSVSTNPAHRSMTRSTIRAIALGIICDPEDDNNNHSGEEFYDDQTNLVQEQHLIPPFGDMEEASGAHNHHRDDDDYNYSEGRPPIVDGEDSSSSNDSSQERFVDEHDNNHGGEETLEQTSGAHHQEQDPLYFL